MGIPATDYSRPAALLVLLLLAEPVSAVDCPPVAGLFAQNTGGGGSFSAMEAPSVKAGLSCTYRDPRDGNQPVAYLHSGWTVSAEKSSRGWCLSYDSTDTRDYELEIDKKLRTFRFVGLSRAFDVQVMVSKAHYKKHGGEWLELARQFMKDNFERAISCRDGSLGPITAQEMAARADQPRAAPTPPPAAASAAPTSTPQSDTPPSQDDIADIIARLKKSQSDGGKD